MRVIAGSAKRLLLKTIDGIDTRPTTDRIKETLFNMIQNEVYGCTFLDLFSGSGGIGIEALSRGAKLAVMVEKDAKAAACIRENLRTTHLEDNATLIVQDVMQALRQLESKGIVFSIIFMDPPYNQLLEQKVLQYLSGSAMINQDTLIIVEASKETNPDYLEEYGLTLLREKVYKTNKHLYITKGEN